MTKKILWVLSLFALLIGCEQSKPVSKLSCDDSPQGRSKEEQTAIADACFRRGSFHKSSGREW